MRHRELWYSRASASLAWHHAIILSPFLLLRDPVSAYQASKNYDESPWSISIAVEIACMNSITVARVLHLVRT